MIKNTQHRCNFTFLLVAITVVLVASGVSLSVQAQDLVWAKRAGGNVTGGRLYSSEDGYGIAVLSDGSALVTGSFNGTATFGPGDPGETLLTSAGGDDIFVARYAATAEPLPIVSGVKSWALYR